MNESTRTLANLLIDYARARKTRARDTLHAYGAELATIDSLALANVGQAVDIATATLTAYAHKQPGFEDASKEQNA